MRFGLALPHYDTSLAGRDVTWDGVRTAAEVAEGTGFASAWVSDHLFLDWAKYGGPPDRQGSLECLTTLAALAGTTDRLRLGSLTLCNDLRAPALVAKMASTLDRLSGGRLEIGLGGGWYEPEYRAAGIPFDPPRTRIRRVGEAVEIIARVLEGEELTFKGEYYTIDGAICRPGPVQDPRPPIWIGGKGDFLLKTAARAADGWNFSWIGSVDAYRERSAAADRACEGAKRDPATLRRSVGAYVLVGRDERDVRARFERLVERTPAGVLRPPSGERGVSWEEFRSRGVAGTVGEVVDALGSLDELGVEEVIVSPGALPFQVADLDDIELVGTEVAAQLRGE
jgi:probable F420-dependent oxidoreductase